MDKAWQLSQPRLGSNERLRLKYLRSVSRHSMMFVECVEQTIFTESGANILIFLRLHCSLEDESNQSSAIDPNQVLPLAELKRALIAYFNSARLEAITTWGSRQQYLVWRF
jgi:hypothetical protein